MNMNTLDQKTNPVASHAKTSSAEELLKQWIEDGAQPQLILAYVLTRMLLRNHALRLMEAPVKGSSRVLICKSSRTRALITVPEQNLSQEDFDEAGRVVDLKLQEVAALQTERERLERLSRQTEGWDNPSMPPVSEHNSPCPKGKNPDPLTSMPVTSLHQPHGKRVREEPECARIQRGITVPIDIPVSAGVTASFTPESAKQQMKENEGMGQAVMGGVICLIGILVTVCTYAAAAKNGGHFVVAWGAIVVGAIQMLRGLAMSSS